MTRLAPSTTGVPLLKSGADDRTDLRPHPIRAEWVIDGSPAAAALDLTRGEYIATGLWSCTAGRFHWHYQSDEIIHILEGEARLEDDHGNLLTLLPGSVVHFSPGDHAIWDVPVYVKKLYVDQALPRDPLSRAVRALRRVAMRLLRR
jgi:uncharacterized protein